MVELNSYGLSQMIQRSRFLVVLAVFISSLVIFARLGELPLRDPDEGRNSEVAREMQRSGAWLVPTYDGLAYLDKPSFYFKAVALSFSVFGRSETSARLPSALSGFALLAMLFAFCRREYQSGTAAIAVIIVATTPLFFAFARHVIFDMALALLVCAAIFAGYLAEGAEGRRRKGWYVAGAAAAGFATLVKGPIGFLLPTLVLGVFNGLDRRTGWLKRYFAPLNLLVFFGVVLPWFIGVTRVRPDFAYYGIIEESFHRFTNASFSRTGPFYYYGLVMLGGFYAWSVLVPEAAVAAWRWRLGWSRADRLFVVWAIVVVLFFSVSKSKLPGYILTAVIALGVLTARLFAAAFEYREGPAARIVFRSLVLLGLLNAAVAGFLALEVFNPGAYERLFGFRSTELKRVSVLFVPALGMSLFLALTAGVARWRRDVRLAFATFLVLPFALLTVGFGGLKQYSEASSARALAARISDLPAQTEVACLESFPCGLPFYLRRYVTVVTGNGAELTSNYILFTLKKVKPWPTVLVPLAERDHWLATRDSAVFLLANRSSRLTLGTVAAERKAEVTELTPGWWGAFLPPGSK